MTVYLESPEFLETRDWPDTRGAMAAPVCQEWTVSCPNPESPDALDDRESAEPKESREWWVEPVAWLETNPKISGRPTGSRRRERHAGQPWCAGTAGNARTGWPPRQPGRAGTHRRRRRVLLVSPDVERVQEALDELHREYLENAFSQDMPFLFNYTESKDIRRNCFRFKYLTLYLTFETKDI